MRLPLAPTAHIKTSPDRTLVTNTGESPISSGVAGVTNVGHDSRLQNAASLPPSSPGGGSSSPIVAQTPIPSSCLFAGRHPLLPHSTVPSTVQVYERSEWKCDDSRTPMITTAAVCAVPATAIHTRTYFGAGAPGCSANWVGEPPQHTRPLYSHIPLPEIHVEIHPALDYDADAGWHISGSPSGLRSCHWSAPATNPATGHIVIMLSATRQRMTVYPSLSPTNTYGSFVTVWDVLVAVEAAMSHLDMTDDACLWHLSVMSRRSTGEGMGRRCVCRGEIPSLEYLRQRYEKTGLAKARKGDDVWTSGKPYARNFSKFCKILKTLKHFETF